MGGLWKIVRVLACMRVQCEWMVGVLLEHLHIIKWEAIIT